MRPTASADTTRRPWAGGKAHLRKTPNAAAGDNLAFPMNDRQSVSWLTLRTVGFGLCSAVALLGSAEVGAQTGQEACGNPFVNHYGPRDFRTTTPQSRAIVEDVHFTPGIESMTRPGTSTFRDMAGDVAYTLGVYPNHHRALITMARLAQRWKQDPPPGTNRTVECWFDRAVRYRPDDTVARALYAQFLHKQKRDSEAVAHLDIAVKHAGDNPLSHHNLGLIYLEVGSLEKALQQAHRARSLGLTRPDLQLALEKAGRWIEPDPVPTDPLRPASATNPASSARP